MFPGAVAACLLLAATPSHAQTAPGGLTLDEAIERGLANSLRIAELQAREEAARATEDRSGAARQPIVAAVANYTRTNHVEPFGLVPQPGQGLQVLYPDVPDNYHTRIDLQWPIYSGGRLEALERAARAERLASGEDLTAARSDLKLEITRAFWALVTAIESERVLDRTLLSIDAHVRDLRNRLEQGLIPPNDVLSAEAQQSRERLLAIEARNTRGIAEADLRRLLGAGDDELLQPAAALALGPPSTEPVPVLFDRARKQRPERRALQEREAAQRARIDAASAGRLPQVGVNGGYDYASPNTRIFPRSDVWNDSWDVSVNFTWTLWDSGRTRAVRAGAEAGARVAAARVADFDRSVRFEIQQRQLEVGSSRAAIATAEDGLRAAAEARRVVGERFAAGVATNTEVLDAESDLLQAELARTRALANARLADARLARAVGQ